MTNRTPKISVVMSVFNNEADLSDAVDSILTQTFTDFEFIIINDASTDNSKILINKYSQKDSRIQIINNPHNIKLTASLNKAIAVAKGDYIARQDADDISLPTRLEKQLTYLDEAVDVGAVGCFSQIIDEEGEVLQSLIYPKNHDDIIKQHIVENQFIHGTLMFRNSLLNELGGYRNEFIFSQDYDLTLRAQEVSVLNNIPETLYCSRFGSTRISSQKSHQQKAFSNMAIEFAKTRRDGQLDPIQSHQYQGDFMQYGSPVSVGLEGDINSAEVKNDQVLLFLYLRAGSRVKARRCIERIASIKKEPKSWLKSTFSLRCKYVITFLPKPLIILLYRMIDRFR